jgi:CubicO group peptidase (beta-lactamase class C family)
MRFVRSGVTVVLAIAAGAPGLTRAPQFPADTVIRAILQERVAGKRSAGIVVGLVEPDGRTRIVAANERTHGEPVFDAGTIFEIGSITKVFTASILADMVATGEVRLEDPVATLLPPGVRMPSRNGRQITLEDLSTQTSGLPRMPTNFAPKDPANPYADYTADRLFAFLSSYTLTRDIGAQYEYSNVGVGLLGEALARRAGVSYDQLVAARVLKPLGMTSTASTLTAAMKTRLAPGHTAAGALAPNWDLDALAGAGALRSTVEDMLKFLGANLNPASSPLAKRLTLTHAPRKEVTVGLKIGLNWHIMIRPDRQIHWHNGGTAGYRTWAGFDLANHRAAVVLTNSGGAGADDIGVHLLDPSMSLAAPPVAPSARVAVSLAPQVLDKYVGEYQLAPGVSLVFTRTDDQLWGVLTGQSRLRYWPESETRFFLKEVDAQIQFVKDTAGVVTGLVLFQNGQQLPGRKIK